MLTKLYLKNFKRFEEAEIDLGSPVVFIGPNDSGKTTALQALALWDLGLKRWIEKRGTTIPGKRSGVAINRRDFIAAPIPNANLLWHDLHTRNVQRVNGKPDTNNVRIEIVVEGITNSKAWKCGFEFDYSNQESFYCRPARENDTPDAPRMTIPNEITSTEIAFLPPMSGLSESEFAMQRAQISWLIGQGRTAEVLRNLCYLVKNDSEKGSELNWSQLTAQMEQLFGIQVQPPVLALERAELTMTYVTKNGTTLDISSAGRGVQQTLLLLSYMSVNPNSVILLDEPDAHLEILRQRQIYRVLCENADLQHSQIVAASHSEIIMNEAADKDVVVAFVGKPHRIDDRGTQLLKSLKEIGFDQYYQAEQRGWVLYLEGATDLSILLSFAKLLEHPAKEVLENPFVHYILNQPQKAKEHFYGLREAKPDLRGFVLCDRLDRTMNLGEGLTGITWKKREIENYLCQPATLVAYASSLAGDLNSGPLFVVKEEERFIAAMQQTIREVIPPLALKDLSYRYWNDAKASDEILDVVFERFFQAIDSPNMMRKTNYHKLAPFVETIDPEVVQVLDGILAASTPTD